MDTNNKDTALKINELIERLKKVSLLSGLLTGVGVAVLYFFGIAIYATYNAMLGIPPFDFSLQNCLEFGGASVVQLLTVLPVLVVIGAGDNLKEIQMYGLFGYFFMGFPVILILLYWILNKRQALLIRKFRNGAVWTLLLFVIVFLPLIYVALLSSYTTENVLFNPAVNTVIQHREELRQNMDLRKVGLQDMDYWTANLVVKDEQWILGKTGAMYSLAGVYCLYALLILKASGKIMKEAAARGEAVKNPFVYLRHIFVAVFIIFALGVLFVVPARTVVLLSLQKPKVDVSILGLNEITSKYYLILAGDYEKSYAFYSPNMQNVIYVQKDKVNFVILKETVSIFADRSVFKKEQ